MIHIIAEADRATCIIAMAELFGRFFHDLAIKSYFMLPMAKRLPAIGARDLAMSKEPDAQLLSV